MKLAFLGRLLAVLAAAVLLSIAFLSRETPNIPLVRSAAAAAAPQQQRQRELQAQKKNRPQSPKPPPLPPNSIYRLSALDIDGNSVSLAKYTGRPAIVVNVASF